MSDSKIMLFIVIVCLLTIFFACKQVVGEGLWVYGDYTSSYTSSAQTMHLTARKDIPDSPITLSLGYHKTLIFTDYIEGTTYKDSFWEKGSNGNTVSFGIEWNW